MKLLDCAEPPGHFMILVPGAPHGQRRQSSQPSTVATLVRLVIHHCAMRGVLDEEGFPLREMGVLTSPRQPRAGATASALQVAADAPSAATRR